MISLQAYRISVGSFQCKLNNFKPKNLTYVKNRGNRGKNSYLVGGKLGFSLKIILLLFLLGVNTNNTYNKICQESNNKNNHISNGNISKKGTISLFTWNKGNSTFKNKRDDILVTLERYKPDIFAIQEANFDIINDRGFLNYSIEANTLCRGHTTDRTILLIKNGIAYKRRNDLENDYISSVWIQIIISKKVSTLISSYYRQWSLPQELK